MFVDVGCVNGISYGRGEGLVLKNPNSAYYLGGRDSKWWVKVRVFIFQSSSTLMSISIRSNPNIW